MSSSDVAMNNDAAAYAEEAPVTPKAVAVEVNENAANAHGKKKKKGGSKKRRMLTQPKTPKWAGHTAASKSRVEKKDTNPRPSKKRRRGGLTSPKTPHFRSDSRLKGASHIKSTEQQQLEEIERFAAAEAERKAREKAEMEAALAGAPIHIKQSHKPLTKPKGFQFRSDNRLRRNAKPTDELVLEKARKHEASWKTRRAREEKEMKDALKGNPIKIKSSTKKLTMPREFHFISDSRLRTHAMKTRSQKNRRAKLAAKKRMRRKVKPMSFKVEKSAIERPTAYEAGGKYIPTAKAVADYSKTPRRFRKVASGTQYAAPPKAKLSLTQPKTPSFRTASRLKAQTAAEKKKKGGEWVPQSVAMQQFHASARSYEPAPADAPLTLTVPKAPALIASMRTATRPAPLSTAELEAKELEAVPKFKARPVSKHVLKSTGAMGLPVVKKKKLTAAKTPKFRTTRRTRKSTAAMVPTGEEECTFAPKANSPSLMKKALAGDAHIAPVERRTVTVPASPQLSRSMRPAPKPVEETFNTAFKANPMPVNDGWKPKKATKLTAPAEFALATDTRGSVRQAQLASKLAEEKAREEQARTFKAQPIPLTAGWVPPVSTKAPTQQQPFGLASEQLHRAARTRHERKLAAERKAEEEARNFKANPVSDKVFVAKPSNKELTQPGTMALRSDGQAEKRRKFDAMMAEKLEAAEQRKLAAEEEKRRAEEEEVRKLRKKLVHKPQPLPKRRTFKVKRDVRPLTDPNTPALATKKRQRKTRK